MKNSGTTSPRLMISPMAQLDVDPGPDTLHRMIGIRLLGFEQTFCDSATTERKRQKDSTGHPQSCRHHLPHAACCQSGIERWHRTGHPQSRDGMRWRRKFRVLGDRKTDGWGKSVSVRVDRE